MGAHGQGWNFRVGASLKIHAARNTGRELESRRIYTSAASERTKPLEFSLAANSASLSLVSTCIRGSYLWMDGCIALRQQEFSRTRESLIVRHSTCCNDYCSQGFVFAGLCRLLCWRIVGMRLDYEFVTDKGYCGSF